MSNVKELADQEAARAEAENPDEQAEEEQAATEGEPESEPQIESEPAEAEPSASEGETPQPPQPPPTEKEIEKAWKSADRADERHRDAYEKAFGPDLGGMLDCPRCLTRGFIYPPDMEPLDADQVMAVHISLGEEAKPDFKNDENTDTCERCAGLGQLVTGSKVPGQTEKLCPACNGSGYVDKETQAAPVPQLPPPPDANGQQTEQAGSAIPPPPTPFWNPGTGRYELPA